MKIIFLSHTPRNYLFKVGSFHLSKIYAQAGHKVLYVPSPLSPFHFLNIPMLGDADYREVIKSRLSTLKPTLDQHNVVNLTPFVLTPFNRGIFDNPEIPVRQWYTFNRIDRKIREIGFAKVDLVIQDKIGLFFLRKFVEAKHWIYRATDDYSSMSRGPGEESVRVLEQKICDYADQVLVTSEPLKQLFSERYHVEAAVLRNGVDASHFGKSFQKPEEYLSVSKPVILYVGSLDQRFDLDLLTQVARQNSDLQYMVIGPGSQKHIPENISNITALGPKPYEEVPAYMQHADVGILPLKMTKANHARSPMKIYEYGICGLPVVSTPLRELKNRNEDFITFAEGPKSFYKQILFCLENRKRLSEAARYSSQNHSWDSIAARLLERATTPTPLRGL